MSSVGLSDAIWKNARTTEIETIIKEIAKCLSSSMKSGDHLSYKKQHCEFYTRHRCKSKDPSECKLSKYTYFCCLSQGHVKVKVKYVGQLRTLVILINLRK